MSHDNTLQITRFHFLTQATVSRTMEKLETLF